jgi:hypothetical protein
MSEIKIGNFLSPDQLENVKKKKKEDLEEAKQGFFSELEMLFSMQGMIDFEKFMMLYNNICDNLNNTIEESEEL